MTLAFIENNEITRYPCGAVDVKRAFPGVSFSLPLEGQNLNEFGVVTVIPTDPPTYDRSKNRVEEGTPKFTDNEWRQTWNTIPLTTEELAARDKAAAGASRATRDQLLSNSDWTVLPDSPLSSEKKTEWQTYRQTLRDIPESSEFPHNITWPTKP